MLIDVNKFKENADESFGKIRDNFINTLRLGYLQGQGKIYGKIRQGYFLFPIGQEYVRGRYFAARRS